MNAPFVSASGWARRWDPRSLRLAASGGRDEDREGPRRVTRSDAAARRWAGVQSAPARRMGLATTVALIAGAVLVVRAAEYGTAAEAKAMLERAAAALKADEAKALAMFSKGEGGFKEKDLYPFCGGPDGIYSATPNPALVGKSMRDQKDKVGKPLGEEIYNSAEEGKITEITYKWPRPGGTEPLDKVTFCTKARDQICCVGYYKTP